MRVPIGANFKYEEDEVFYRVFYNYKNKRIKVVARSGNRISY